ncbi:MAG TPA: sensor histidine kinase KdpD [Streptosporangiaceae bacterium]|jgi:two-component system sensor histidine kinase KdpD|nr:sensor histidine kinase KdpD [Streptosporangiaceae bacterium]
MADRDGQRRTGGPDEPEPEVPHAGAGSGGSPEHAGRSGRGHLRIYLGSAAGVGKTYAMLSEGHRRAERGADVVVAFAEAHGRPQTSALLDGIETIPRARLEHRGASFEEMDLAAVLARRPEIALVDELAHTNVPGSRNEKRWQDVEEILDAGIDVISAVNIQHLESLNDVVEKITGVPQRETVPDAIVRAADQVEMVDMTPEALRRRMAHGNIYPPEKIDAALTNYFRSGNLDALRELALLWLADKVDEGLQRYRTEHKIQGAWEARERVVVALTGGPEGRTLIRRAARIAARSAGGDLLAVHVTKSDGLTGADPATLASQRRLVESVGGTYHQVVGDNIPEALLAFARAENATQLVLGASRRSWLTVMLTGPGIGSRTIKGSGDIDVHIVTHGHMGRGRDLPRPRGAIPLRRKVAGYGLAAALSLVLTVVLASLRSGLNLTSDVLMFLVAVILVALVGGFAPAVLAAIAGSLLLNYYFTPPIHQFTIAQANNALALGVFVVVALLVSSVVDMAARRTKQAARANAESELLATTAGSVLRGQHGLSALLERVREAFGMDSVTLLERTSPDDQPPLDAAAGETRSVSGSWHTVASCGEPALTRPEEADVEVPVADTLSLALRGRPLPAADRRVLSAFASYAAVALDQQRLTAEAQAAKPIAAADRMRTALLAAVSHDLRTPLASAKAAVTSLRSRDVDWGAEDHDELLATADESLDQLTHLVDNLLDMSRLQAGALSLFPRPVALEEIVSRALDNLDPAARGITVDIPESLPEINVDPAILERVIVNLTENALRYAPAATPPLLTASALADRVELRVVDRGPGIPEQDRDRMFVPFQRLGDTDNTTGVGLGLALSRGLTEAMGGTLTAEDTPGGGLTMTISVPVVTEPAYEWEPGHREREAAGDTAAGGTGP